MTEFTGGLWRYHEDDVIGIAEIPKLTIINSSKEMSSFSDFQTPKKFPNYMHNTMMVSQLQMQANMLIIFNYIFFRSNTLICMEID